MKIEWMTLNQVARALAVTERTVERRIRAGSIRAHRNDKAVLVSDAELRRYLMSRPYRRMKNPTHDPWIRDWDNPIDALYDNWRKIYGVRKR